MCRYTKCLRIIKFSRADIHFIFIFMSRLSYYPLLSVPKLCKNGITFETTSVMMTWWFVSETSFGISRQCRTCYVMFSIYENFRRWLTKFCTESQDRTKSRFRPGIFKNLRCHLKTYLVSWIFSKACFPTAERYLNCLRFLFFLRTSWVMVQFRITPLRHKNLGTFICTDTALSQLNLCTYFTLIGNGYP